MPSKFGRLLLLLTLVTGSACAKAVSTATLDAAPALSSRVADTIFFVSARARDGGRTERRFSDTLEFGLAIHTRRRSADVLTDGLDLALVDSVSLTQLQFIEQLRLAASDDTTSNTEIARNADSIALLYVHGYSTSLHECWRNASESRMRSRSAVPWVAFCWPSNGLGFERPARGAILDRAYREDSAAAAASAPAFLRTAEVLLDAVPPARLLVIAHSMGSQLVGGALADSTSLRARLEAAPVRAIVFAAADMETSHFTNRVVPAMRPLSTRLVAYVSGRDRMLALSRQRSGTSRAGLRKVTPLVLPGLESIDATEALVAENWFQGIFGTHHAVRRASAELYDLVHIVGANRSPECRAALGTGQLNSDNVWQLLDVRPDLSAVDLRCARHDVRRR